MKRNQIRVIDATQNNLKRVSVDIPKHQITVVTGVSGSGKSSLVLDTIAAQSRRELNDTFPSFAQRYLPKYGRPTVGRIENLPPAIVIDQQKPSGQTRSTVATYTDIYSLLRLLFSRVGEPFVGFSDSFSFNHPQGRCTRCDGLGEITEIDVHKLVDFDKCLNDPGVINYVAYEPGQWRWLYYGTCGLYDPNKKIRDFTPEELHLFLYQEPMTLKNPPADYYKNGKYEGLMYRMNRMLKRDDAKVHWKKLEPIVIQGVCPECQGKRLNPKILSCKILGKNIADITRMSLSEVLSWLEAIDNPIAVDMKAALGSRIRALIHIGLDYLTLDRPMGTLSGGEAQRCKIAKYNNSSLSDMLYVLDEPSVGLHSHDIHRLSNAILELRDRGNTVLMVEHHKEMMEIADHIIDMGPGAGALGGEILFEGSYRQLIDGDTLTGRLLREHKGVKSAPRKATQWMELKNLSLHNLKNIDVSLPGGLFTVIAGVAGSGKSSLMQAFHDQVGEHVTLISQKSIGANLRSTPATYLGVADDIRKMFARLSGRGVGLFSFNGEGACPVCHGKGVIVSEMAFMDSIETVCESCGGLRYSGEALQYRLDGLNIAETMDLTVRQAMARFKGTVIEQKLKPLSDVGLFYLHLNQALSTLSGGELQRMKLASHLGRAGQILVLDEPTDGLHLQDVQHIIALFDELVDQGNSLFLIEHNLEVLKAADYVIEVGPGGGDEGGRIIFEGTPAEMLASKDSVTAPYLKYSSK
ncbi:excinuclease ABC subunit UvrA [Alistipes sp.]|uniref:excinuclease ABC subunit UvrA n=1 Tax=Alistipes sp. TaxID=1872444 RepID=UPI0025C3DD8D|nr:excinuclease ABC subunit UvrA [Alistipes sp.]